MKHFGDISTSNRSSCFNELFCQLTVIFWPFSNERTLDLLLKEVFLVIGYTMELAIRVWSAGCRSRYQDLIGRIRFMKQPFNLLDLIICGLSFMLLTMRQGKGNTFAPYALRGLKFLQILRIVRMDRRAGTWKLLGSVVYLHRQVPKHSCSTTNHTLHKFTSAGVDNNFLHWVPWADLCLICGLPEGEGNQPRVRNLRRRLMVGHCE